MGGDINDKNQLYALCQDKETLEYHVFFTEINDNTCVYSEKKSICGVADRTTVKKCASSCIPKTETEKEAAKIGEIVCGNCMKSMYKTL